MLIRAKWSALRDTRWSEYLVRFVLGGAMTVVAGLIAARFGAVIGGLFLAFPAIFPASVTLVEKHVRERKENVGIRGAKRGRDAAALDAAGTAVGSIGLAAFAVAIWFLIEHSALAGLVVASLVWLLVAIGAWLARRRMR
jgi:uncharacterized protein DUF3147